MNLDLKSPTKTEKRSHLTLSSKMSTVISIPKMPIRAFLGFLLACCFISGIAGDVPDGVVYTDLHKTVRLGDRVVLKCQFLGTPLAVYWKKGNDPTIKQSLMSWFGDEPLEGTCVKDKNCDIGDDFSLIIKNISIADQNRYICRVANYKGILIYNVTDVKVYAFPEEPYPVINECKNLSAIMLQDCQVSSLTPVNITCTSMGYFPSMDLFFLHGKQQFETTDTLEWTNTDGTKSKSVFTTAPPSEKPYVCVAFNIPGSREQRTATITVTRRDDAKHGSKPSSSSQIVSIVVPIASVVCVSAGIILFFAIYWRRQRGGENKNYETMSLVSRRKIQGKISYYELWLLVRHFMQRGNTPMLRDTLRALSIPITEMMSEQEAYEVLCKWKDDNSMDNEAEMLEDTLKTVLKKKDYNRAWNNVCGNRKNSSIEIDSHTFEHILWNISGLEKINEFLCELTSDRTTSILAYTEKRVDVIPSFLKELTKWSNGQFELNPLVLLSSALERVGCRLVARTFFLVPGHLTSPLEQTEIKGIVRKLTSRHCKRLASGKISSNEIDSTIDQNDKMLFDTSAMITDWFDQLECSNYEKRCRMDDTIIKIGRYDMQDCLGTISYRHSLAYHQEHLHPSNAQLAWLDHESVFDDDIAQLVKLVKYIPPDKLSRFSKKTGFSADRDDSSIEEELKKKRDDILARSTSRDESLKEFKSLRDNFKEHSRNVDFTLTDEEINDVVAQVTSTDEQQQLIRKLHVSADDQHSFVDQLKKWRNTQANIECRKNLQESLKQIGFHECIVYKASKKFFYHAEVSNIALNLLMEDVRPIIDALAMDRRKVGSYIQPVSDQVMGTKHLVMKILKSTYIYGEIYRDDFCEALRRIGFVDVYRSVYFDYEPSLSELIHIVDCVGEGYMDRFLSHLDLVADDIEECRDREGQIDKLKLMRLWKRQIRPVPYHYRLEIVAALKDAGMNGIAKCVLSGEYRRKGLNADVLHSICSRMGDEGLIKLCTLLKLDPESKNRSLEASATLVTEWANEWMKKFDPSDTGVMSGHMRGRKDMNDRLYMNGFCELAEEISALESC